MSIIRFLLRIHTNDFFFSPVFGFLPVAHFVNKYNVLEYCPPGSRTGTSAAGSSRSNHLATVLW